jgi:hypothetical protein
MLSDSGSCLHFSSLFLYTVFILCNVPLPMFILIFGDKVMFGLPLILIFQILIMCNITCSN